VSSERSSGTVDAVNPAFKLAPQLAFFFLILHYRYVTTAL
jgi:hypothetical protein